MIQLRDITEDNFSQCIKLEVADNQKSFVASNVHSLAEAWLHAANARPLAIFHDDEMVGFLMLDINPPIKNPQNVCGIWRFMIDKSYQGKGYGRAAMQALLPYAKEKYSSTQMMLTVEPTNEVAKHLYGSLGFMPSGEYLGDLELLALKLW